MTSKDITQMYAATRHGPGQAVGGLGYFWRADDAGAAERAC